MSDTLWDLLAPHPADAKAIGGAERPWLSYGALRELAGSTVQRLNGLGIGRGDRVAIVLPNGPEMAAAFVAIGCGATTAPLNPGYREEEYNFYISDLNAKALVVTADYDGPALAVAAKHGVQVLRLRTEADWPAGRFELQAEGKGEGAARSGGFADSEEVALVLHTSGTTSRPKIVPLLQRNLVASVRHIGATLSLTPEDRCLNVMPLFHIHGLIAAVLFGSRLLATAALAVSWPALWESVASGQLVARRPRPTLPRYWARNHLWVPFGNLTFILAPS